LLLTEQLHNIELAPRNSLPYAVCVECAGAVVFYLEDTLGADR
jgi:hypothetical protein